MPHHAGHAAPVGRGGGDDVEALRAQHHRHRVAGRGLGRLGHVDEQAAVQADPGPAVAGDVERAGQEVGRADEPGDEDARRRGVDLLRRADLLDEAAAHHGHAVAHRQRLALVVGDEDERDPDLPLDPLELDLHGLAQLEVEGGQRLVQQQRAGQVDQRPGQGDTLLLAAGELRRTAGRELGQAHDVEHLHCPPPDLGGFDLLGPQAEGDVVEHRHVGEEGVLLEHRVDVALVRRDVGHVDAFEHDTPARRPLEAGDHLQQRGLAAPRRSEQGEELTAPDGEVGPVDGHERAELLAHTVEDDDVVIVAPGAESPIELTGPSPSRTGS